MVNSYRVTGVRRVERSAGYGTLAIAAQELWPATELRKAPMKARQVIAANISKAGRASLDPMLDLHMHPTPVDVTAVVGGKPARRAFEVGLPERRSRS